MQSTKRKTLPKKTVTKRKTRRWPTVLIWLVGLPLLFLVFGWRQGQDLIDQGLPSSQYSQTGGKVFTSPNRTEISEADPETQKLLSILAAVTEESYSKAKEKRRVVTYGELHERLVNALIAIEERNFRESLGFSPRGIGRAIKRNWDAGKVVEGGSGITQQLIKASYFPGMEKTWVRKYAELWASIILETRVNKNEIIEMLANQASMGTAGPYTMYGFQEFCIVWLGKPVNQVTEWHEIATILAAYNGNSIYSPRNSKECMEKRNRILDELASPENTELTKLTPAAAEAAKKKPLPTVAEMKKNLELLEGGYAAQAVIADAKTLVPKEVQLEHCNIYSTIDEAAQRAAVTTIADMMPNIERQVLAYLVAKGVKPPAEFKTLQDYVRAKLQVAIAAVYVPTGEVAALVGGKGLADSQFNRAIGDGRPSGSNIKPFLYAKAVQEKKLTLRDTFLNGPLGEGYAYKPGNYGKYSNTLVSFEDAIALSLNNGAVIAAKKAGGVRPIANFLKRVGLPQPEDANETMFLGSTNATPLAIANAYRIFVPEFGGNFSRFHFVRRITDEHGKTLYHFQPKASEVNVISQETAITITHALQEAVRRGTGQAANGVFEFVAGKSGSSHDAWFTGYTPRLVVTVWIGFDDFRNLDHFTGGQLAAPIWKEFMLRLKQSRQEYFEGTFLQPKPAASPTTTPTASPSATVVPSPTVEAPILRENEEPTTQPSPSPSPVATRPRIAVVAPAEN